MDHFAYLIEEADNSFFGGVSRDAVEHDIALEKTASSIGELVAKAGKESLHAATRLPRAAVRRPVLRRAQKLAADLNGELELLKVAGSRLGYFGMTKAASGLLAELEGDQENSGEDLDAAADILAGSALEHDLGELWKEAQERGVDQQVFKAFAEDTLRKVAAGIGTVVEEAIPLFRGGARVARGVEEAAAAEGAAARAGKTVVTGRPRGMPRGGPPPVPTPGAVGAEAGPTMSRWSARTRAAATPISNAASGLWGGVKGVGAALAHPGHMGTAYRSARLGEAVAHQEAQIPKMLAGGKYLRGEEAAGLARGKTVAPTIASQRAATIERQATEAQADLAAKKKELSGLRAGPGGVTAPTAPPPESFAGGAAAKDVAAKSTQRATGATAGAEAGAEGAGEAGAKGKGMMHSINKFLRGEQLSPDERAHVIKAGLGAFAVDRYALHGGRES